MSSSSERHEHDHDRSRGVSARRRPARVSSVHRAVVRSCSKRRRGAGHGRLRAARREQAAARHRRGIRECAPRRSSPHAHRGRDTRDPRASRRAGILRGGSARPPRRRGRRAGRSAEDRRVSPYGLLPFRFVRFDAARTLVVNEAGEHQFLENDDFTRFVQHELPADSDSYLDLKAKHFLFDSESLAPFELLATKYRTKKAFLEGFTSLQIFVVSLRCEHSCVYCQVSRVSADRVRYDMTEETARRALDLAFRSPAPQLKIELQGGEPLLNFERVRQIVVEGRRRAAEEGRPVAFVVTTNLALLDDDMLLFFREHGVFLSTSLDGPEELHDANRPRPGNDSHARTIANIRRAREAL